MLSRRENQNRAERGVGGWIQEIEKHKKANMADEGCVDVFTEATVVEEKASAAFRDSPRNCFLSILSNVVCFWGYQVEDMANETDKTTNDEEEFERALERVTSRLWDDRSRNKSGSKGKRKRISKEEEKSLSKL